MMRDFKDYRWCTAHQDGHKLAGPVCPEWSAAIRDREALTEHRLCEWRRADNRGQRFRRCLVCNRVFDAGSPKRGRPKEMCGETCIALRDNGLRKRRHAGIPTRRKRSTHRLRTRPVGRLSPEVESFLQSFPSDGGWFTERQ